jgi:hypothetical protein
MAQSKKFIIGAIKNLLTKNYKIDPSIIDLEAQVDGTLSYGENWNIIKEKLHLEDLFPRCPHCGEKL